jgi:hypothetical protein
MLSCETSNIRNYSHKNEGENIQRLRQRHLNLGSRIIQEFKIPTELVPTLIPNEKPVQQQEL